MKSTTVTISLNEEEMEVLQRRIKFLKELRQTTRVSKSEAIRHALMNEDYLKANEK